MTRGPFPLATVPSPLSLDSRGDDCSWWKSACAEDSRIVKPTLAWGCTCSARCLGTPHSVCSHRLKRDAGHGKSPGLASREQVMIARIPLALDPQPEGGYTVTSPLIPELITEGDTISEALANAEEAFAVVLEIYEDEGSAPSARNLCGRRQRTVDHRSCPLRSVTYREAARRLMGLGCYEIPRREGGSHRRWFNPQSERNTPIPDWGRRDLKIGTLRAAVRQLGIDWQTFQDS